MVIVLLKGGGGGGGGESMCVCVYVWMCVRSIVVETRTMISDYLRPLKTLTLRGLVDCPHGNEVQRANFDQ